MLCYVTSYYVRIYLQCELLQVWIPCIVSISFDRETRPLPAHFAVCRRSSGLASIKYLRHNHIHQIITTCTKMCLFSISTAWQSNLHSMCRDWMVTSMVRDSIYNLRHLRCSAEWTPFFPNGLRHLNFSFPPGQWNNDESSPEREASRNYKYSMVHHRQEFNTLVTNDRDKTQLMQTGCTYYSNKRLHHHQCLDTDPSEGSRVEVEVRIGDADGRAVFSSV